MASEECSQFFVCHICMERKRQEQSFKIQDCGHEFCSECITEHVKVKIGENSAIIKCMEVECQTQIYPDSCQQILNAELLEKWSMMLTESLILPSQKFYCPFESCSALLWDDTDGREVIREAECPYCGRLFCAQCKVDWHAGMSCSEFQRSKNWLGANDDVAMKDNRTNVIASEECSQFFFCHICMERKRQEQSFKIQDCGHEFCSECITEHVKVKMGENSAIIRCMEVECQTQIYPDSCQQILNAELLEKWSMMLTESLILPLQKFYCPFESCSALLWDDTDEREVISEAECPYCWRLFCAQCKVGWHAGMSCSEFQRSKNWLGANDEVVMKDNRTNVIASEECSQFFFCHICMERKRQEQSFKIQDCGHEFCSECITEHVKVKMGENSAIIRCMEVECQTQIYPDSCQQILNAELLEKWSMMLTESLILPSQKFYCPFESCSALLWDDTDEREVISEAECPYCWRLFCAQCKVGWHAGMSCSEFQRSKNWLGANDEVVMKDMANQENWQRCPMCKFYVDKISGCVHITCRCGYQFCYRCGSSWTPEHHECKLERQTG